MTLSNSTTREACIFVPETSARMLAGAKQSNMDHCNIILSENHVSEDTLFLNKVKHK